MPLLIKRSRRSDRVYSNSMAKARLAGTTTVSAGSIDLVGASALQNSTITVQVASGLKFDAGGSYVIGGLAGTGDVSLTTLSGPVALTGSAATMW